MNIEFPSNRNQDEILVWFDQLPEDWARFLASRTVLRSLPFLYTAMGEAYERQNFSVILHYTRAIYLAWTSQVNIHIHKSEIYIPISKPPGIRNIGYAALNAITANGSEFSVQSFAHTSLKNIFISSPNNYKHYIKGIHNDYMLLRHFKEEDIRFSNIWLEHYFPRVGMRAGYKGKHKFKPPRQFQIYCLRLKYELLKLNQDWDVWTDWYEARLNGDIPDEVLEYRKATISEEIWSQSPAIVNAHIKQLIKEREEELRREAEDSLPTQSPLAQLVGLTTSGQLTYIVPTSEEALDDTPVQRGAYDDLLELKNTLCGFSHNQLGALLSPLTEKLTKVMPERIEEARKNPLWRVMNRLRITLADHNAVKNESEPSDARLNAHVASTLSMFIEEYNVFAMGDSGLRSLDEQKPGPQEREKTYKELLISREIVKDIALSPTMATDDLRADLTDILKETPQQNPDLNHAQRQEQEKHTLSNVIATKITSTYHTMKKHLNGEGGFVTKEMVGGVYKIVIPAAAAYNYASIMGVSTEMLQLIVLQADLIKLYYAVTLPNVNVGRVIDWIVMNSKAEK